MGREQINKLDLDEHDAALAQVARDAIDVAVKQAHAPAAVAKRIVVRAMQHRNKGRIAAQKSHPFRGICEASGLPLKREDARLDELDREKGFSGRVRWVCDKANNSGKKSCGGC